MHIHFPPDAGEWQDAIRRLKFEELFIAQLRLSYNEGGTTPIFKRCSFLTVGELFNTFYKKHLPFELTGAQKRVIKEIQERSGSGKANESFVAG